MSAKMCPRDLVNRQAEDEGLWFVARTAPEAYLQKALRDLHASVEAAAPPQADAEALIEVLRWYAEKAESMSRYMDAKPPKDNAMLAIMVELSLDAGNRARPYLAAKDAP